MPVVEALNSIDFWFGLATGVACHKIAGNILKTKLSALVGNNEQSNGDTK